MRISDWSSDVCSSDLAGPLADIDGDLVDDGVLRFDYTIAPSQGLDPHKTSQSPDVVWTVPVYDALITELPDASLVPGHATSRSEERRVEKECISKFRSRRSPSH